MKNTQEPKWQHYIPRFYLAGFTDTGNRGGKLWVFNKSTLNYRQCATKSVGAEQNLYTAVGVEDPYFLEMAFAEFETRYATPVLQTIRTDRKLPDEDKALNILINFMARLVAGIPRNRRAFFGQNAYLDQLLDLIDVLIPVLGGRAWSLASSGESGHSIVSSDNPVMLEPLRPVHPFYRVGFGSLDTLVIMPISRDLVLCGSFEGKNFYGELGLEDVAKVNTITLRHAHRYLYSQKENFCLWSEPTGIFMFLKDMD